MPPGRGNASCLVEGIQRPQPVLRRGQRGSGRRIEPRQAGRILHTPLRQRQHQRSKVAGEHFRRIESLAPGVAGFLPQSVGHARPLPRGAPGPLCRAGLAGTGGDKVGDAGGHVEPGAAGQAAVHHHADPVERDRGFGDAGGQHHAAAALRIAADGCALVLRHDLPVQRQDRRIGQALCQPLAHPLDLAHAGEEGEDIALLLPPCGEDRRCHRLLDPLFRAGAEPFDAQGVGLALAGDHRGIVAQQPGKARAIDGG